jgi:hypothetical protein
MAHASCFGNPRSKQAQTVQKSAKPLKPDKVYTLTRVDFCWRSDAVPKESCRSIGRCRDIDISGAK